MNADELSEEIKIEIEQIEKCKSSYSEDGESEGNKGCVNLTTLCRGYIFSATFKL